MTQRPTFDYDYIIIGSGAGGSPAASILVNTGKKVAVVEKATFGGESPNWGDIPTGALLHAAHTYRAAKLAARFGLRTATVGYNYPSLLSWRDTAIKRTGVGGNRSYYEKQGISVFAGSAHFLSPNEISVNRRHLSARKFLIATGADWSTPTIPGAEDINYHTPKTILNLTKPPKTLFIVGSGVTAIELAHLFSAFGTKIYVAETARQILPDFDTEVSDLIASDAKKQRGMTILTQTRVVALQKEGLQKRVTFTRGHHEQSVRVDEVLIADNRSPATDLGLENAGIKYSANGIEVDTYLRTSARHIFAAGSVVNPRAQTHEVLSESRVAAHNMIRRNLLEIDPTPELYIAFTQPEIAQVGLNEYQCIRRDLKIRTSIAPLTLTARSNITDQRIGFVKLISDKKGILLGASIVGLGASDMVAEVTLAIRHKLTAEQLMTTPHCFTSWSEAIRIAAGKLL